jgi:hypothetical protein
MRGALGLSQQVRLVPGIRHPEHNSMSWAADELRFVSFRALKALLGAALDTFEYHRARVEDGSADDVSLKSSERE